MDSSSTFRSYSGPVWSRSSSYRWMCAFCLVERALAPLWIHAISLRRMDWRLRDLASAISSRSAFSLRNAS